MEKSRNKENIQDGTEKSKSKGQSSTVTTGGGGDCSMMQKTIDNDSVLKLVSLLSHEDPKVVKNTVRAVGSLAAGTDEETQALLNCGALPHFHSLLKHPKKNIIKDALWILSNITSGTEQQIQAVIDAQLIQRIINLLDKGVFKVQLEAAMTVSNMILRGNMDQVGYLINNGVLPPFCNILSCNKTEVLVEVLDSILRILKSATVEVCQIICGMIEECGGMNKIEELQNHQNVDICNIAYEIIDKYFNDKD